MKITLEHNGVVAVISGEIITPKRLLEGVQIAAALLAKVDAEKADRAASKVRTFWCDGYHRHSKPRYVETVNAFDAAELYAALELPNQRAPWAHQDRDAEKLAAFGSSFVHVVKSAEGKRMHVKVSEAA